MKNLIKTDFDNLYGQLSKTWDAGSPFIHAYENKLVESICKITNNNFETLIENLELLEDKTYKDKLIDMAVNISDEDISKDTFIKYKDFKNKLPEKFAEYDCFNSYYTYLMDIFEARGRCNQEILNRSPVCDAHHIIFHSFGGEDSWENLILLTRAEHIEAHTRFCRDILEIGAVLVSKHSDNYDLQDAIGKAFGAQRILSKNTWWGDDLTPDEIIQVRQQLKEYSSNNALLKSFNSLFVVDSELGDNRINSQKGRTHNIAENGLVYFPYNIKLDTTKRYSKNEVKELLKNAEIQFGKGRWVKSVLEFADAIKPGNSARKVYKALERAKETGEDLRNDSLSLKDATFRKAFGWEGYNLKTKQPAYITIYFFMLYDDLDALKAKLGKDASTVKIENDPLYNEINEREN